MEKMVVFDNLGSAINEGAIVFGATILQGDAPRTWVAQKLMNRYNQEGVSKRAGMGVVAKALRRSIKARL